MHSKVTIDQTKKVDHEKKIYHTYSIGFHQTLEICVTYGHGNGMMTKELINLGVKMPHTMCTKKNQAQDGRNYK